MNIEFKPSAHPEGPPASASQTGWRAAAIYFLSTFSISWLGAFLLVAPRILRHEAIPKFTGLMMFPIMLLGPSLSGIYLTWRFDGRAGIRDFLSRLSPRRISARFLSALLVPPLFVVVVLFSLAKFVSADYTPNRFFVGAGFGLVAGFFEELGWTGFAFPKMLFAQKRWLRSAIVLGILWGCWHIPVIDYLGAATPHGRAWLSFFLVFTAAMIAIRILICWLYTRTRSVLFAQLFHAFSTSSLVVLSPASVTPRQEALWYALYAACLWLLVLLLLWLSKRALISSRIPPE